MDNQMPSWIDREMIEVLSSYHIEIAAAEGMTTFVCPRMPPPAVKALIERKLPHNLDRQFIEDVSIGTTLLLIEEVEKHHATIKIQSLPAHRAVLDVSADESSSLKDDNVSVWGKIMAVISRDSFVESFEIRLNGEAIFTSEASQTKIMRDAAVEVLSELEEEVLSDLKKNAPPHRETIIKAPEDNRFDYDRDYLPTDVGTDVKILLESCNTVEDFLKSI